MSPHGAAQKRGFMSWLRRAGPGFWLTAAFVGLGTVTTASAIGARYGAALLWALLFSVGATMLLQEMAARLGLVTGGGLGEALGRSIRSAWKRAAAVVSCSTTPGSEHSRERPIVSATRSRLAALRQWDGRALPAGLRARLAREWERVVFSTALIERLESERRALLRHGQDPAVEKVRQLNLLRGIGVNSAWLYGMELFSWREFRNRKEVGAIVGLAPTPDDSGQKEREKGMSKAGNRHVRAMAVEHPPVNIGRT